MNRITKLVLLIMLIVSYSGYSLETLTLKNAIKEALENNPDIQSFNKNIDKANADLISAKLKQNPNASLIMDILPMPGQGFNPLNKVIGGTMEFPLDLNNRRGLKTQLAGEIINSVKFQTLDFQRQLKLRLKMTYFTAVTAEEKLDLSLRNFNRLNNFIEITKYRLTQKDISGLDLSRAEMIRDGYNNDIISMKSQLRTIYYDMQFLMGRSNIQDTLNLIYEPAQLKDEIEFKNKYSIEEIYKKRPDYLSLLQQIEAEKINKKFQESFANYDMSLQGDLGSQQNSAYAGVTLNFILPMFNKNEGEIEKSKVTLEQLEINKRALENSIKNDFAKSLNDLKNYHQVLLNYQNNLLAKSETILKTVEYSYKNGNTSILDYLEAQRSFEEVRTDYINYFLQYELSKSFLETTLNLED